MILIQDFCSPEHNRAENLCIVLRRPFFAPRTCRVPPCACLHPTPARGRRKVNGNLSETSCGERIILAPSAPPPPPPPPPPHARGRCTAQRTLGGPLNRAHCNASRPRWVHATSPLPSPRRYSRLIGPRSSARACALLIGPPATAAARGRKVVGASPCFRRCCPPGSAPCQLRRLSGGRAWSATPQPANGRERSRYSIPFGRQVASCALAPTRQS